MTGQMPPLPRAFVWRRLHSLAGIWLSLFIIFHLLTNSQAALMFGEDGKGFIHDVNFIHSLPYLLVIEIVLLGIPILIHAIWGIKYALTAKFNSFAGEGVTPDLSKYPRNHAYSWQRITSWILLVGIVAHVIHMRFIEYPEHAKKNAQDYYMARVSADEGLITLSERLGVELYAPENIEWQKKNLISQEDISQEISQQNSENIHLTSIEEKFTDKLAFATLLQKQKMDQDKNWVVALSMRPVDESQVVAVAKDFGTADLLIVRDVFKSPFMMLLYTVFVLAACFHGFNGLWTFMITWGVTLSVAAQRRMWKFAVILMVFVTFLGLIAIWGTYWINLKQ